MTPFTCIAEVGTMTSSKYLCAFSLNSFADFRCALRAKFWADMWRRREWSNGLVLGCGGWHVLHASITPITPVVAVDAYVLIRVRILV